MRTITSYMIKQFVFVLLYAVLSFLIIFLIVDVVENLDRFISKSVPALDILKYYVFYTPYIIVLTFPIAMLLSSLFSVGQMARYNEIIAMKASGISLYRILTPLILLALLISGAMLVFGEVAVPWASQNKAALHKQYFGRWGPTGRRTVKDIVYQESKTRRVLVDRFKTKDSTAFKVSYLKLSGIRVLERVDAKTMTWDGRGWIMHDVVQRQFAAEKEKVTTYDRLPMPEFDFTPRELVRDVANPDEMSYGELKEYIASIVRNGGDPQSRQVDLNLKLAFPFANFIIVLFGAPLASARRRGGPAVGILISLFTTFAFFGLIKTTQSLGHNGLLSPFLAAWMGNFVFGAAGCYALVRARK